MNDVDTKNIGHETGQITGQRVLETDDDGLIIESSFQSEGEVADVDVRNVGTFTSRRRADGTLRGKGHGLITTPDGQQVPWRAIGIGQRASDGSTAYKATLQLEPSSTKLDALARTPLLATFEVQPDGSIEASLEQWV